MYIAATRAATRTATRAAPTKGSVSREQPGGERAPRGTCVCVQLAARKLKQLDPPDADLPNNSTSSEDAKYRAIETWRDLLSAAIEAAVALHARDGTRDAGLRLERTTCVALCAGLLPRLMADISAHKPFLPTQGGASDDGTAGCDTAGCNFPAALSAASDSSDRDETGVSLAAIAAALVFPQVRF